MENWNNLKVIIDLEIKKSNISNKEAIKLIFNLERKLNTCRNFLSKNSWTSMINNCQSFHNARIILEGLLDNHLNDLNKYCDSNGHSRYNNIGDLIC